MIWPDLRQRTNEPELLDLGVPETEVLRSLRDLRFVNRWLGNAPTVLEAIRPHLAGGGRLLDVGSASGDLPAYVAARVSAPLLAVALDVKALHLRFAPSGLRRVVADVRAPPFEDRSFDVVTVSLVLHHFADDEIPGLLASLYALARRALVVNDLERKLLPYAFGRLFFGLLFKSPVSVVDGLASIRRGFRAEELGAAFKAAGIPRFRVVRRFPYRLLAIASRPEDAKSQGEPALFPR